MQIYFYQINIDSLDYLLVLLLYNLKITYDVQTLFLNGFSGCLIYTRYTLIEFLFMYYQILIIKKHLKFFLNVIKYDKTILNLSAIFIFELIFCSFFQVVN